MHGPNCSSGLTTLVALSLVTLSLLSSSTVQSVTPRDSTPWPMFHQNPQHTGLSSFQGPQAPFLKWRLQTGGRVDSPPAVGRGRIYLTSEDGNVYALNLQGVLQWKFQT